MPAPVVTAPLATPAAGESAFADWSFPGRALIRREALAKSTVAMRGGTGPGELAPQQQRGANGESPALGATIVAEAENKRPRNIAASGPKGS